EISASFDQLSVPGSDRWHSGLMPLCEPNFNGNTEALARLVERLVNARTAAMDDDDITAQTRDKPFQYHDRQLVACPCSFAGHYDTHVHILATMQSDRKTSRLAL